MISDLEQALLQDANTDLAPFRARDPGKHIQTLVPTPEWKGIAKACELRGISLSLFLRVAARQYLIWLANYRSPSEIAAPKQPHPAGSGKEMG